MVNIELKDLITLIIALAAIIISFITFFHAKRETKTAKTLTCLTDLFSAYKITMANANTALEQSKALREYLQKEYNKDKNDETRFSDFNEVYYSKDYEEFRNFHYFFELLGTLMRQKEFNRMDVWSYFSFPLEFFIETKDIRHTIKYEKCLPAYAKNFILMFLFYNKNRDKARTAKNPKVDGYWIINGRNKPFTRTEVEELSLGYKLPKEMK